MNKIISLVMLCVMSMMSANAAEKVLWEGDHNVSWEEPEGSANREWKELGQADFAAMDAGQKLYFYFDVVAEAEYHKYNFDNWSWVALPGHEAEHAETFSFSENTKVEFEVTKEIKDAIAAGGFAIHGHGFHVVKVTAEADDEGGETVTAEQELWSGDHNVSWEESEGSANREWKELGQADFAAMEAGQKLYFYFDVVAEAEYHKYNFDDLSWVALPGHEAEHAETFSFSENTKVEFEVTQEIKDAIAAGGFAIHGHGFHVVKVTKLVPGQTTIISPSAGRVDNTNVYDLNGQLVAQPTKGLYIMNGKKIIIK